MKFLFLVVLISFVVFSNARPCNRCAGVDELCGDQHGTNCRTGYVCTSFRSEFSSVCLPTVATGEQCNLYRYDPCPSDHYCDPNLQTCEMDPGLARINDGCLNDDNCNGQTVCQNNKCVAESNTTCSNVGCPVHQNCKTIPPSLVPSCVDKGGANADCDSDNDCWLSSCLGGSCRAWYSGVEASECGSRNDCKLGLTCETQGEDTEEKCHKPLLHYIDVAATGSIIWGRECDASRDQGCQCNPGSGAEQLLIESHPGYTQACADTTTRYYECLKTNNCYQERLFQDSCLRANCYTEIIEVQNQCLFFGANPTRCSASDLMLTLIMIIAFLLL